MSDSHFKPFDKDFEFRQFPFYWISRVGNRYEHRMEFALKKVGMNITSWRVCMILRENGAISMSDIATHAVARLPTITKVVYKLKEKGLVEVKPSLDDARVSIVKITTEGDETLQSVLKSTTKIFNEAFEGFSEEDIKQLNTSLAKLFTNIEG